MIKRVKFMKNHLIGIFIILFLSTAIKSYGVEEGFKIEVLDSVSNLTIFNDIDCFDINNCAVVRTGPGLNGLIVSKTSDGGKHWEIVYTDTTKMLDSNKIYFPEDKPAEIRYYSNGIIRIFTIKGRVVYSVNNGLTWDKTDKIDNFSFSSLVTLDSNRAVFHSTNSGFGDGNREIYKTNDGCKTWSKFLPDSINDNWWFFGASIQYDNNVLLACYPKDTTNWDSSKRGFVLTDFEGSYWNFMQFPNYVLFPYFINKGEAIAIGNFFRENKYSDTAVILKTYDAGKTWDTKFISLDRQIYTFSDYLVYDDSLMYVFGEDFDILKSTDKGENWYFPIKPEDQIFPSNYVGSPVMPVRNVLFFLTTFKSRVIRYSPIELSVLSNDIITVSIYPNPAADYIDINISNRGLKPFVATDKFQIFDILGIEIQDLTPALSIGEGVRIDVSHLSPGVYFIRIGDKVEKFVKI